MFTDQLDFAITLTSCPATPPLAPLSIKAPFLDLGSIFVTEYFNLVMDTVLLSLLSRERMLLASALLLKIRTKDRRTDCHVFNDTHLHSRRLEEQQPHALTLWQQP